MFLAIWAHRTFRLRRHSLHATSSYDLVKGSWRRGSLERWARGHDPGMSRLTFQTNSRRHSLYGIEDRVVIE